MNDKLLAEVKEDLARGGPAASWPAASVERLVGEIERLRGLLAKLEWSGAYREDSACPVCYAWEPVPGEVGLHEADCWLAEELALPTLEART